MLLVTQIFFFFFLFVHPSSKTLLAKNKAVKLSPQNVKKISQVKVSSFFVETAESQAQFLAKITMSQFEGVTKNLKGVLLLDEEKKMIKKLKVIFPVLSIKTGLSLRDKHMRKKKYLYAKKYKTISFRISKPQRYYLNKSFQVKGVWNIRGVELESSDTIIEVDNLTFIKKNKLKGFRVRSHFQMDITKFGIKQPKYMVVKMEPVVDLKLQIQFNKK